MDPFDSLANIAPGAHVMIRTGETAYMAGVVERIDAEARTLHFTDGRHYTCPPEPTPVAESEPEEEPADE